MAHFVRLLALAETLDPAEYDIFFYAPPHFSRYLQNKPFATGDLASMPAGQFVANIDRGKPPFPADVIRSYVHSDRKLIQSIRPGLVIGDMRLSLPISARLEGVRYAVLINAYWSPYARHYSLMPALPISRIIPPRLLSPIYRCVEPLAYAIHVGPMNRVRKEFGVPPLPPDIRAMYTEGDHVLYADVPEFVPTNGLPENHHYVGICEWTPPIAKPDWWDDMLAGDTLSGSRPKVFVSLGSSGPLRALPALLKALSTLPVSVLLATSGRHSEELLQAPGKTSGMYVAGLLPFTATAAISSVVVSHGGSGGLYPAMAAGTPVLGIPSNADQLLSTAFLEDSGAGIGIRVEEASEKRLRGALEKLLLEPRYREAAQKWAGVYRRYDSGVLFREFLGKALN